MQEWVKQEPFLSAGLCDEMRCPVGSSLSSVPRLALLPHCRPRWSIAAPGLPSDAWLWAHRGYSYTKARAYYRPLLEFPSIAYLSAGHLASQIPLPSSTCPLMPEPREDYLHNVGVSQSDYNHLLCNEWKFLSSQNFTTLVISRFLNVDRSVSYVRT